MTMGEPARRRLSRRAVLQGAGASAAALPLLAVPDETGAAVIQPAPKDPAIRPTPEAYEAAYREALHEVWRAGVTFHQLVATGLRNHADLRPDDAMWLYALANNLRDNNRYLCSPPYDLRSRIVSGGYASFVSGDKGVQVRLKKKGRAVVAAIDGILSSNARHMYWFGPDMSALATIPAPLSHMEDAWREIDRYRLMPDPYAASGVRHSGA
ncbi:MAG: hypothetical protein Q8O26_16235 [Phreatobacter sp.]|uniref:hypothetical protein n=1 Tax=Phreatobacter sp. TaxID=1966341 RepID=UPI002735C31A|nr:hypothetical protein [Phreatobacter sp.]MDP2803422.1 hypothetical protein [Phreatobacter sp.]